MNMLVYLSNFIIPLVVIYIVMYAVARKIQVFDEFTEGAKRGAQIVFKIMPTLVGLMVAIGILRASGVFDVMENVFEPVAQLIHFPVQLIPLSIIKMFSSSAATGLLLDIFKEFGTDSYIGKIASIMMSCTETIFYTMSVYFMAAKVSKTRWTLAGAMISTLVGTIASVILVW